MATNPGILDSQRKLARSILAGLVTVVVLFVLFASGPSFGLSFAQQGPAQIEFLNPSGTNFSEEISTKPDGRDTQYHLVAWVNQLPANASVEFRYLDPATGQQVSIASGTQTGIPDTFHTFWDPPDSLPDGPVTIYAILFSGTTEIDRDTEEDPVLNDKSPTSPVDTSEPRAETVEIVAPAVGGAWGMFTPRDRATAGILNIAMSDGTTFVRVFYTVSSPGTDPAWVTCGTETRAAAADGVRCTLSSQHSRDQVTGVAALANDTAGSTYAAGSNDSGDAHRVQTYEQVPGAVALDQSSQSNVQPGRCSRIFTATLTDQFGIVIPNANMDVHAKGPADEIAFDDGSSASANKPPDVGSHSSPEAARDCSADPPVAGGQQGEHIDPAGSDTKHVESAVGVGTSDAGRWSFQLYSPAIGTTDFAVWTDVDDDDTFCSNEKSASGSVGWGGTAAPVGIASETSTCPSPSPSSPAPGPTSPGPGPTPDPRGCTITGTDDADVLDGTEGDDIICGLGGNDIISGLGGDDVIYGDAGRDDIKAGAGNDTVRAGTDKDTVRGDDGNDELFGGAQNDLVTGGDGDDEITGQTGFDTLRGGAGSDSIGGGFGSDNITGGPGADFLFGGRGKDSLVGGSGVDRCRGNGGRDSFSGCEAQEQ